MEKEYDVIVYMRHISLEVVIPEEHVWNFMVQFGKEFSKANESNRLQIKPVDSYFDHPNGWHVQITVWEGDEEKFYDFLRKFCGEKGISFREPETD